MNSEKNFWEAITLKDMSSEQWESLCDGCGKCCSHKFINEETGEILFTSITCSLFDPETCKCSNYINRFKLTSECLQITSKNKEVFKWLPPTCAYRLLHESKALPKWHHLLSGSMELVHSQGHSVKGRVIFESDLDEGEKIQDFICSEDL